MSPQYWLLFQYKWETGSREGLLEVGMAEQMAQAGSQPRTPPEPLGMMWGRICLFSLVPQLVPALPSAHSELEQNFLSLPWVSGQVCNCGRNKPSWDRKGQWTQQLPMCTYIQSMGKLGALCIPARAHVWVCVHRWDKTQGLAFVPSPSYFPRS